MAQGTHADDDPRIVAPLSKLGDLKFAQSKYSEAPDLYEQAFRTCEKTIGPDSPRAISIYKSLMETYRMTGDDKKAEELKNRMDKILNPPKPVITEPAPVQSQEPAAAKEETQVERQ